MKWRIYLRGTVVKQGGWTGGHDAEAAWTLSSEPALPAGALGRRAGRDALLAFARRLCSREGGLIVILNNGTPTHAMEWRDAGELDPEASGNYYEKKLDPRDFRGMG